MDKSHFHLFFSHITIKHWQHSATHIVGSRNLVSLVVSYIYTFIILSLIWSDHPNPILTHIFIIRLYHHENNNNRAFHSAIIGQPCIQISFIDVIFIWWCAWYFFSLPWICFHIRLVDLMCMKWYVEPCVMNISQRCVFFFCNYFSCTYGFILYGEHTSSRVVRFFLLRHKLVHLLEKYVKLRCALIKINDEREFCMDAFRRAVDISD